MSTVNPHPAPSTEAGDRVAALAAGSAGAERLDDGTGLKNLQLLIQLRWIAVVGQLVTIGVVSLGLGIALPLQQMLLVLSGLILFNIISQLRWRTRRPIGNKELFLALLVDVAMLSAQLFLSGGASNPFTFLYLLQIALGAVLLQAWSVWTMLAITLACFIGLVIFGWPLALPRDLENGLGSHYMQAILVCFVLNAALLVIFITRISRNLQERDARLASLRQRAAEEEHIVRMGLLASGAAHELGTPLSTLAVILGDWQHMPALTADPVLQQEIGEMQAQVLRCKTIVSGILLSAGETRGESSARTSICTFIDGIAAEWRHTRPVATFAYQNRLDQDLPMVSDSTLQQMLCNVLDNALEASPAWVGLDVVREADTLSLSVSDRGPGFLPAMLAQLGKPYQSSKGRTGGGLGLFLVVNVARTLGGTVTANNRPEGGAVVNIRLPLSAIAAGPHPQDSPHAP